MKPRRQQLIELIERGAIPSDKTAQAVAAAEILPDGSAWRRFLDQLLLWLGSLALAFSVLFFVAYNWDDLGRFAKFGLVQGLLVLAVVVYCRADPSGTSTKAALLVATILLGVLLALFGQTYQTGADPWQLFANWALLMIPWAIVARFPVLWILWVGLINLSIALYGGAFGMFGSEVGSLWLIFLFNTAVLALWESCTPKWPWLEPRWAIRLLAVAGGVPLTGLVIRGILEGGAGLYLPGLVWALWLAGLYWVYRSRHPDLFMLAGGCLSGIVVVVTFLTNHLLDGDHALTFLFLALLVIGLGTGAALWLRKVQREWTS
ncbi:MAG: DUF2157 domain-containing protein [Acidobacteriota bacterium]